MSGDKLSACPLRAHVDPRLTRFSGGATASVLVIALLILDVARPWGLGLLASQVAVFAFTAFVSFQWSLWAQIYARLIWPRVGAPAGLEDARPARFAQFFGFLLTALALTFFVVGVDAAGYYLTGPAFGLAALNASTGLCSGCKPYWWIRRLRLEPTTRRCTPPRGHRAFGLHAFARLPVQRSGLPSTNRGRLRGDETHLESPERGED